MSVCPSICLRFLVCIYDCVNFSQFSDVELFSFLCFHFWYFPPQVVWLRWWALRLIKQFIGNHHHHWHRHLRVIRRVMALHKLVAVDFHYDDHHRHQQLRFMIVVQALFFGSLVFFFFLHFNVVTGCWKRIAKLLELNTFDSI